MYVYSVYGSPKAKAPKDIESLSKIGLSPEDISRSLDLSISFVKSHIARINEDKAKRMRFLRTGILPEPDVRGRPGVFTIFQR